jgi:hypothetical protein
MMHHRSKRRGEDDMIDAREELLHASRRDLFKRPDGVRGSRFWPWTAAIIASLSLWGLLAYVFAWSTRWI